MSARNSEISVSTFTKKMRRFDLTPDVAGTAGLDYFAEIIVVAMVGGFARRNLGSIVIATTLLFVVR
jgi:hypothetical protein